MASSTKYLENLRSPVPLQAKGLTIFSDFDGTVTRKDSLRLLLDQYARPEWQKVQRDLRSGVMAEKDGLQKAFDCLNLDFKTALKRILSEVEVDPYFVSFARWCKRENFPLVILSGGFSEFILPLLERAGIDDVPVLANGVRVVEGNWRIQPSKVAALCSLCNHCKSASLLNGGQTHPQNLIIYIGDGHTDFCARQLAHLVFAKGDLQKECEAQKIDFFPFADFRDIELGLRLRAQLLHR